MIVHVLEYVYFVDRDAHNNVIAVFADKTKALRFVDLVCTDPARQAAFRKQYAVWGGINIVSQNFVIHTLELVD
jgi:hypothetical protein